MEIVARAYDDGRPLRIRIEGTRIAEVQSADVPSIDDLPWIAPGFVDLLVGGVAGRDFTTPELSAEQVAAISAEMDRLGVVAYCPTVRTASLATLRRVLRTLAEACDQSPDVASHIAGIHLDGPFISPEDGPRGTHPAMEVRPADWNVFCRLQEAARGRIRMLTLSPEGDSMPDFIERVTADGVSVAIGRTAASADQIRTAVDAGARLSMHLGTAVHGRLRRHPNYLWDQLAEDRLDAALTADDRDWPDTFARIVLRSKSPKRCLLVSDLQSSGGTPIACGIEGLLRSGEVSRSAAIEMASTQPARWLGLPQVPLAAGARADLVLLRLPPGTGGPIAVVATIRSGAAVFGDLPDAHTA